MFKIDFKLTGKHDYPEEYRWTPFAVLAENTIRRAVALEADLSKGFQIEDATKSDAAVRTIFADFTDFNGQNISFMFAFDRTKADQNVNDFTILKPTTDTDEFSAHLQHYPID